MKTAFLLVSVRERDIKTAQFPAHDDAHKKMLSELKTEFLKEFNETEWDEIREESPVECETDCFGYSADSAWSNVDDDLNCDWLIVPVTVDE